MKNENVKNTPAVHPTEAWKEDLESKDMPWMRDLIDLLCEISPEETVESIRYIEAKRKAEDASCGEVPEDGKNPPPLPEGEAAQMFIELCEWMFSEKKKREVRRFSSAPGTEGQRDSRTQERQNSLPPQR